MRPSNSWANDRGSAALEFVTVGLIMMVPLVFLVLTLSSIQAGALAAEGAARQAARVFVQSPTVGAAQAAALRAVEFALADHGLEADAADVAVSCHPQPDACLTRRGLVTVTVNILIPLPVAPAVLTGDFALAVPVTATATQQVSRFWSGP